MTTHTVKTILAAINDSREDRSLFKEALALASSMRARVVLVSVTPGYEGNMNRLFIPDSEKQLKSALHQTLDEAEEYAKSLGLTIKTVHRTGKPCEEIIAVAAAEKADLILLGCANRFQMERILLGRTTFEIIINAPCDVMIVPEDAEIKFDRILVGISGSPASMKAGLCAIDFATTYGGEVHALYVTDVPTDRTLRYRVMDEAEKEGWDILKEVVQLAEKVDAPIVTAVVGNQPEECLVAYAKQKEMHLIVLGAQDKPLGFDIFCGSVIERVASSAPCPILVAKNV